MVAELNARYAEAMDLQQKTQIHANNLEAALEQTRTHASNLETALEQTRIHAVIWRQRSSNLKMG